MANPSALEAFFKMRAYNSADERDIVVKERTWMTSALYLSVLALDSNLDLCRYEFRTSRGLEIKVTGISCSDTKNKHVCGIYTIPEKDDPQKTALEGRHLSCKL